MKVVQLSTLWELLLIWVYLMILDAIETWSSIVGYKDEFITNNALHHMIYSSIRPRSSVNSKPCNVHNYFV
jgi:hypothetical protein